MTGPSLGSRFCANCGRLNEGARTTCFGCGAPLAPAAYGPPYGGQGPPPGPTPPPFYQPVLPPPGFPGLSVPGVSPPPPQPPQEGLSTVAIVVIVVVVVVAATLIPAAILYVLVSGLNRTTLPTPYELGMSVESANNSSGPPPTAYLTLALSPTPGLATAFFGLQISNASTGVERTVVESSSGCAYGVRPSLADCPSDGVGWYGVLVGLSGTVVATYGASGWSHFAPGTPFVLVTNSDSLLVVSNSNFTSAGLTIHAFGTGSTAVSGTAML